MKLPETIKADRLNPPVTASVDVGAPLDAVWAAIVAPRALEVYHPFVATNPQDSWSGVGATDTIGYFSGLVLEREIYHWIEGEGFDLMIGADRSDPNSLVEWRLIESAPGRTRFDLAIVPLTGADGTSTDIAAVGVAAYASSVARGLAHHCETGERVRKNQFGYLPVFSTPDD